VDKLAAAEITTAMVSAAFGATAAQPKHRDDDPFKSGDFVVYPTHGVGKIDRIGTEEIGGHKLDLISISFDENKMTLRIPVAQARVSGLRKLATPEAMAQVMTILAGRPKVSRLMWAKRAQEFQAKINSGDLRSVAEVCRDLQTAANGAAPSYSQRNLFELAIDRLAGEFAGVVGTDKADAIVKLTQKLIDGRSADSARTEMRAEKARAGVARSDAVAPEPAVPEADGPASGLAGTEQREPAQVRSSEQIPSTEPETGLSRVAHPQGHAETELSEIELSEAAVSPRPTSV
jgi:CarD family transcriptional regulator